MKILIYGESYWYGVAIPLCRDLKKLDCETYLFDWTKYLFVSKAVTLTNRILDKFLTKYVVSKINKEFLDFLKKNEVRYDLILVLQGKHLCLETVKEAKKYCKIIANWNIDEFFNPNAYISKYHLSIFDKYDCIFTARKNLLNEYYKKGAKCIDILNWFYYPEAHYKINISEEERIKCGSDIAFLGSWSKNRENTLSVLANLNIRIWGDQWHKASKWFRSRFNIMYRGAWFEEMSKVIASSRVIVDVLTKENLDETNLKCFQVPACGGLLIINRNSAVRELLTENEEIVCYDSLNELREKCLYYISNERERKRIAENGYIKITQGENTLFDRAKQIKDTTQDIIDYRDIQ